MRYKLEPRAGYLLAEMVDRETAEETAEFVRALVAGLAKHKSDRVLISVRTSRPIYKVEGWACPAPSRRSRPSKASASSSSPTRRK